MLLRGETSSGLYVYRFLLIEGKDRLYTVNDHRIGTWLKIGCVDRDGFLIGRGYLYATPIRWANCQDLDTKCDVGVARLGVSELCARLGQVAAYDRVDLDRISLLDLNFNALYLRFSNHSRDLRFLKSWSWGNGCYAQRACDGLASRQRQDDENDQGDELQSYFHLFSFSLIHRSQTAITLTLFDQECEHLLQAGKTEPLMRVCIFQGGSPISLIFLVRTPYAE